VPLGAILFDVDDTLFSTSGFARAARRNAVEAMIRTGLRVSAEDLLAELEEVVSEFSSNYDHHFDRLLLRLPPAALQGLNHSILVAAAVIAYHDTKFTQLAPYPDVVTALAALSRTTSLRLGVLTEGLAVKQAEKLLRLRLHDYLDPGAIFISDVIGISKPNPKLYRRALESLDLPPGDVMYVGDNPHMDIDPANREGMITVRVRRGGKHHDRDGVTEPDHAIASFGELVDIIRSQYLAPGSGLVP
jgi:putative hydrolase of the HAD superfamily